MEVVISSDGRIGVRTAATGKLFGSTKRSVLGKKNIPRKIMLEIFRTVAVSVTFVQERSF